MITILVYTWFIVHGSVILTLRYIAQVVTGKRFNHPDFYCPKKGRMDPPTLNFKDFSAEKDFLLRVKEISSKNEPIVIKNLPAEYFEKIHDHKDFNLDDQYKDQTKKGTYLVMDFYAFPDLGHKLNTLLRKIILDLKINI